MPQQTICLVEGDTAVRHSLGMLLEQQGMRVASHKSAGAFLRDAHFDDCKCFLFDGQLPELTGMELLEVMRTRGVSTPAIIMTANGTPQLTHRAARAGAIVLHKPMSAGELLDALRRVSPVADPSRPSMQPDARARPRNEKLSSVDERQGRSDFSKDCSPYA